MDNLAGRLIEYRKRQGLNMPQLADALGVHKSQITRWETGQQKVPRWVGKLLDCLERCPPASDAQNTP